MGLWVAFSVLDYTPELALKSSVGGFHVNPKAGSYIAVPTEWVFDERLSPSDLQRLIRLLWRYEYFKSLNPLGGELVFFPSQQSLCGLLGWNENSRTKVSEFLSRMESFGYVRRVRSGFQDSDGNVKPRNYIIVNRIRGDKS